MRPPRRRRSRTPEAIVIAVLLLLAAGVAVLAARLAGAGVFSRHNSPAATRPTTSPSPSASPTIPALSLETIFDHQPDLSKIPESRKVTMIVTGDVIPARTVNVQIHQRGDYLWPFRATVDLLHGGDMLYTNLEAPLIDGCPVSAASSLTFCGDPKFIDGLKYAGVTVANISNNHITNYGKAGSDNTITLLQNAGIQPSGLGLIARVTIRGVRFAFLGFDGVLGSGPNAHIDRAEVTREIQLARPTADVLVVQYHWGREYMLYPQPASIAQDDPKELGRWTIDQGADLVIGNHPHAVEGLEVYKGKLITFAHGNFVFDQMFTPFPCEENARNGVIGKYVFVDGKLAGVTYLPIEIFDFGQPRPLSDGDAQAVLARMKLSSQMVAGLAAPITPPPEGC